MRWCLIFLFAAGSLARAAELQWVAVMTNGGKTFHALRAEQAARVNWCAVGDRIGGFVVAAYQPETETLTLRRGDEMVTLRLPQSKIQMAEDDVVAGLKRVLDLPGAKGVRDLLHPKLRPLFKPEEIQNDTYRDILRPGTKLEIREIPEEFAKALEAGLADVARAVGVRPTHGLWIVREKGFSMVFIVKEGPSWYLAPGAPGEAEKR